MKFLTPAFIRVENPAERQELIEWLKSIDYKRTVWTAEDGTAVDGDLIAVRSDGVCICVDDVYLYGVTEFDYQIGSIDCGTNVALFRALAAMNDSNDREQWFVVKTWPKERMQLWRDEVNPSGFMRKAIAEEIIKHFNENHV